MGIAPSKAQGIKDVGTVASYRHLVELGLPRNERAFKLADRVFHRLLSRDEDPALLFEYKKAAKTNPHLGTWSRTQMREGATTALAHAGHIDERRGRPT